MDKREAEYWRGYGEGVHFRIRQRTGESIREHYRLQEEATGGKGDSHVDAYTMGYRDGCKEETVCLVLPARYQSDRQRVNGAVPRRPLDDGLLLAIDRS